MFETLNNFEAKIDFRHGIDLWLPGLCDDIWLSDIAQYYLW